MQNKVEEAKKILLGNRKNGYTLPTNNKLYPAQWNWDSAFIALGYSYFNLDFSITEIETLLNGQWEDGMIPHILFHEKDTSYFCLLYTSPSPRDFAISRMPSSA